MTLSSRQRVLTIMKKYLFALSFLILTAYLFAYNYHTEGLPESKNTPQNQTNIPQELDTGSCLPAIGSSGSIFNIFILNNANAPFFEEQKNQIINSFRDIQPFKDYFDSIAFFSLEVPANERISCESFGAGLGSSGFICDPEMTDQFIKHACNVNNTDQFVKIVLTETDFGGSGGEVITIGSRSDNEETSLGLNKNVALHETGHNMGLGDLYYGTFYFNGNPSRFLDKEIATNFPNTDDAGCPKWCKSFYSVSTYPSNCQYIEDEQTCRSHNREEQKNCPDETSCCVWDDETINYFGKCAPTFGTHNIGIDCVENTGCYYGAAYGNDAWRPIAEQEESIMYSPSSNSFDAISETWLRRVLKYCLFLSAEGKKEVDAFQREYLRLIQQFPRFKQKIGLCR